LTLFLAPEAALTPFYATHAYLARLMVETGHPAVMLSCRGIQRTCSAKMADGVRYTAPNDSDDALCRSCHAQACTTGREYGLTDISMEELLDDAAQAEIQRLLAKYDSSPGSAVHDNIEFGTACLGETLRARGKTDPSDFTPDDVKLLKSLLQSALSVYFALKTFTRRFNTRRIVYFGDYAYFLPAQIFARRNNIALTHISHAYNRDIDRRYLSMLPGFSFAWGRRQVEEWHRFRDVPVEASSLERIFDGALFRLVGHGGVSTFSPNWNVERTDIRRDLPLEAGRKTIVAFTSSFDEAVCVEKFMHVCGEPFNNSVKPFPDQAEWLRQIVDWVGGRSDLQLVIRLHPRMAPNVRHSGAAEQYARLLADLSDLPRNVILVGADSKLSSYNIAEIADIALVAWSSMGVELARFGVPVVVAFPALAMFPVREFAKFGDTPERYFHVIERTLRSRPTLNSIVEAFRWSHFLYWSHVIDVSDLIPRPDHPGMPPTYRPPRNAERILSVLADGKDIVCVNFSDRDCGAAAIDEERRALIGFVERLIVHFLTGMFIEGRRLVIKADQLVPIDKGLDGDQIVFESGPDRLVSLTLDGRKYSRFSPLVHRLSEIRQNMAADVSVPLAVTTMQPVLSKGVKSSWRKERMR
jgi:hypothetical protein